MAKVERTPNSEFIMISADSLEKLKEKYLSKFKKGFLPIGAQKRGNRFFLELIGKTMNAMPSSFEFKEIQSDPDHFGTALLKNLNTGDWSLCGIDRIGRELWGLLRRV